MHCPHLDVIHDLMYHTIVTKPLMKPLTCVSLSCPLQLVDLSAVSPELAYAAEEAELVILEGMVSHYPLNTWCMLVSLQSFLS